MCNEEAKARGYEYKKLLESADEASARKSDDSVRKARKRNFEGEDACLQRK